MNNFIQQVGAESERDSAQSSCRIFEKQLTAVKEAAAAEKKVLSIAA